MKIEQLIAGMYGIQMPRRSYYSSDLPPWLQKRIIRDILDKLSKAKLPRANVVSSYKDWQDLNTRLNSGDVVIVQNTYKIIERANSGSLFKSAKDDRHVFFLFFLNEKIKKIKLIEEWEDFFSKAHLAIYSPENKDFNLDHPLLEHPQNESTSNKLTFVKTPKFISFITFLFISSLLLSFPAMVNKLELEHEVIPYFVATLVFLLFLWSYVYGNYRITKINGTDASRPIWVWFWVVLVLAGMDTALGLSFLDIASQIYKFVWSLLRRN